MQKIATPTAVSGAFVPGNPGIGQPATKFSADWCNAVQSELVNLVEGAGLTLNPANNAQVLQAVGAIAGAGASAYKNNIRNGGFEVWQRGTSFNVGAAAPKYTADRFLAVADGTLGTGQAIISRQFHTLGQTVVPGAPLNYLRWSQAAAASQSVPLLRTTLEDVRRYSGNSMMLSLYAKANSAVTVTIRVTQYFGTGGSVSVEVLGTPQGFTTSWQRFTFPLLFPSVAGASLNTHNGLRVQIEFPLGWDGIFDTSDWQLEPGNVATGFERIPLGLETALCERYFQSSYPIGVAPGSTTQPGALCAYANGTIMHAIRQRLRQRMRLAPAVTWYGPATGDAGKILELDNNTQHTVVTTVGTTDDNTGSPEIGSSLGADSYSAHWAADAEFPA